MTKRKNMADMNNDIRNLTKWLNEDQEAPLDRQALARILAMAEQPAQHVLEVRVWRDKNHDQHAEIRGYDKLPDGEHVFYTSLQPTQQQEPKLPEFYARFEDGLVSVYQRREDATPLLLLRENLPDKQPAQRKPLTDEQIDDIWNRYCDEMGEASVNDALDIARAIEAKLKEKNT